MQPCVATCPVGAIGADGAFNFSPCYTHNYREFMGGFADWVENIADSRDGLDYRRRVRIRKAFIQAVLSFVMQIAKDRR